MNETEIETEDFVLKAFALTGFGWIKKHNGEMVEGKAIKRVDTESITLKACDGKSVLIHYADVEDAGYREVPESIDDSPARVSMFL